MSRLDYEFSPIDVSILTHPKACAAGPEAMGLWLWGQCFARVQRTGGRAHRSAVLAAWGGRRNIMLAKKLVEAGLWIDREDGDWDIHNFEAKASGQVSSSAKRMRDLRERRKAEMEASVTGDDVVRHSDVTVRHECSPSPSYSLSESSSEEIKIPEEIASPGQPPGWFQAVCDTIETSMPGETIDRVPAWLRYEGERTNPNSVKAMSPKDAQAWLVKMDIREAREARERARTQKDREAKWDKQREKPGAFTEPKKYTPEELAEISRRVPFTITNPRKRSA